VGYRSRTTFATKSAVSGSRSMLTAQSSNEASSARLNTRRDTRRTAAAESNDRAPSSGEPPARCSIVLEITPDHACKVVHHRVRREITRCFFRFNLNLRIRRHQFGRDRNPLADLDPGVDERIVLEV
jgi:hypothetical protein